jgi:hypothetical protein
MPLEYEEEFYFEDLDHDDTEEDNFNFESGC